MFHFQNKRWLVMMLLLVFGACADKRIGIEGTPAVETGLKVVLTGVV